MAHCNQYLGIDGDHAGQRGVTPGAELASLPAAAAVVAGEQRAALTDGDQAVPGAYQRIDLHPVGQYLGDREGSGLPWGEGKGDGSDDDGAHQVTGQLARGRLHRGDPLGIVPK
ncbi:hypothetical protein D9M71_678720 [compost metagenome]